MRNIIFIDYQDDNFYDFKKKKEIPMDIEFDTYHPFKDGVHNDGEILSQAIKDCALNHHRLIINEGIYKCGTIFLRDECSIYLAKGAKIKLSDDDKDFFSFESGNKVIQRKTWKDCSYNGKPEKYFIYGKDIKNITIDGEGIIDGSEELFVGETNPYHIEGKFYPRTPLIYLENSKNIKILNITLQRSAFWTVHMVGCDTILIDAITIKNNPIFTNSDGIDPDHSKNIIIRNCTISCADDCIVIKSTSYAKEYGPSENIEVYNCKLSSTCAAIKLGTESYSDFNNIYFHDIDIVDTNRGISLMIRDGGSVNHCRFENIKIHSHQVCPIYWWGRGEPISITNLKRNEDTILGSLDNISFKNITCDSENGITIVGDNLKSIYLDNISLNRHDMTSWEKKDLDLRPSIYDVLEGSFHDLYIKGDPKLTLLNTNIIDIVKE